MDENKHNTPYHTSFSDMIMCSICRKMIFVPINLNGKRGSVKVIFKCIFCGNKITTTITK